MESALVSFWRLLVLGPLNGLGLTWAGEEASMYALKEAT